MFIAYYLSLKKTIFKQKSIGKQVINFFLYFYIVILRV